eukprot:gnl/TRDRNA2_/TRDRNA2_150537_c4_seq1.p1 gnl/TRDRNA2_/TRDRNA2_150537_c4~~gnl/TRDRNA2_/TRDRNA2_150537_c4_seq1.p1  ORF type:complete len:765 (-),score=99.96 gnl/TRDRNA2_/TRDRNA2_150537_c4_seq1:55-2349(-)
MIAMIAEEHSTPEVVNGDNGHMTCRIQYHMRISANYDLRSFPFDCQRLEVALEVQPGYDQKDRFFVTSFCDVSDQCHNLDQQWRLLTSCVVLGHSDDEAPNCASILILVDRVSVYYAKMMFSILFIPTFLQFAFYLLQPISTELPNRLIDTLKLALTQTTLRFSIEPRLPKAPSWTPFELYLGSCQLQIFMIALSFLITGWPSLRASRLAGGCDLHELETTIACSLLGWWLTFNLSFIIYAYYVKASRRQALLAAHAELLRREKVRKRKSCDLGALSHVRASLQATRPWEVEAASIEASNAMPQLVSIAFRIWLIRNIDPMSGTFDCKFRVFLEWLDQDAVGLEKGKKVQIPVPDLMIANAVQCRILDRSSAPEVVNSDTGHLAAQILYRATLKMEQQVELFPFDCQWLAINVSLREALDRNRSFLFQYCEVDGQLQFDEWEVHAKPAYSSITKTDSTSIQDTVMCGVLVRRNCRYYVVNIMFMLWLISTLAFSVYVIDVRDFWERAEVFLGIFPLLIVFKISAQHKIPRVGYQTWFDRYATNCQRLFLMIVGSCVGFSLCANLRGWLSQNHCEEATGGEATAAALLEQVVGQAERAFVGALLLIWITYNLRFSWNARRVLGMDIEKVLHTKVPLRLQDDCGTISTETSCLSLETSGHNSLSPQPHSLGAPCLDRGDSQRRSASSLDDFSPTRSPTSVTDHRLSLMSERCTHISVRSVSFRTSTSDSSPRADTSARHTTSFDLLNFGAKKSTPRSSASLPVSSV